MTPDQINRKIAELCGYSREQDPQNYYHSLDACREFEKQLTTQSGECYAENLSIVVFGECKDELLYWHVGIIATAEPHHRCEAFLRMKGEWV